MAHEPRHWSGRSWMYPSTRKYHAERRKGNLLIFVMLATGGFVVFNLLIAAASQVSENSWTSNSGLVYLLALSISFVVYTRLVYYAGNETGKDEARRGDPRYLTSGELARKRPAPADPDPTDPTGSA